MAQRYPYSILMCGSADSYTYHGTGYVSLEAEASIDSIMPTIRMDIEDLPVESQKQPQVWQLANPIQLTNTYNEIEAALPKTESELKNLANPVVKSAVVRLDGGPSRVSFIVVVFVTSRPTKRSLQDESNDPVKVVKRLRFTSTPIPDLASLLALAEKPLSEEQKIPMPANVMQELTSGPGEMSDVCSIEDIRLLFREGPEYIAFVRFHCAVMTDAPQDGTESSWHSFWDQNVRRVLEFLVPNGTSIRDNNQLPNIHRCRPDYAFILDRQAIYRGEEMPPESNDDPKEELSKKLFWLFSSEVPYVLGYYSTGSSMTLVAITPPTAQHDRPVVHDIVSADLRFRTDRIKNICRLINLASLFEPLSKLAARSPAEFKTLPRDDSVVHVSGLRIVKEYTGHGKFDRF